MNHATKPTINLICRKPRFHSLHSFNLLINFWLLAGHLKLRLFSLLFHSLLNQIWTMPSSNLPPASLFLPPFAFSLLQKSNINFFRSLNWQVEWKLSESASERRRKNWRKNAEAAAWKDCSWRRQKNLIETWLFEKRIDLIAWFRQTWFNPAFNSIQQIEWSRIQSNNLSRN